MHRAEANISKNGDKLRGVFADLNNVRLVAQWRRPALNELVGQAGMGRGPTMGQPFN